MALSSTVWGTTKQNSQFSDVSDMSVHFLSHYRVSHPHERNFLIILVSATPINNGLNSNKLKTRKMFISFLIKD